MSHPRWQDAGLRLDLFTGAAIEAVIPDIAALRLAVFRDFPYLYDGDETYERRYLAEFSESPRAMVVVVRQGERAIGAATGAPLAEVEEAWSAPFRAASLSVEDRFYCAESVLLPQWRGLGIGHAFFDAREAYARDLGLTQSCFCSVIRPPNHPARPAEYRPNDAFWTKRGYRPLDGITARFAWSDIGEAGESEKLLQFWGRTL